MDWTSNVLLFRTNFPSHRSDPFVRSLETDIRCIYLSFPWNNSPSSTIDRFGGGDIRGRGGDRDAGFPLDGAPLEWLISFPIPLASKDVALVYLPLHFREADRWWKSREILLQNERV